jgi:hypothetical protein
MVALKTIVPGKMIKPLFILKKPLIILLFEKQIFNSAWDTGRELSSGEILTSLNYFAQISITYLQAPARVTGWPIFAPVL